MVQSSTALQCIALHCMHKLSIRVVCTVYGFLYGTWVTVFDFQSFQVAEVFSQGRAFANVKLPAAGLKNVCGIAT